MSTIDARRSQAQKNLSPNGYPQRASQYRETFSETQIENFPPLGHNGPPSDAHSEDEAVKFLYVQLHIGDYITGTMGMTPELEGAYCRFLIRLYQRGRAFPDNDKTMCAVMGLTTRVWKRLKDALMTLGKIIMRNGCLTNERFEKERLKRAEQLRKQADAAHKRHARERAERKSLAKVSPKFEGSLGQEIAKQSANFAKKPNEINETTVMEGGESKNPITNNLNKKKEESRQADSDSRKGPASLSDAVNERTSEVVARVARWICDWNPDYQTSQHWLKNNIHLFGEEVVRDAYAEMLVKMASGNIVAQPLKLFARICQTIASDRARREAQKVHSNGAASVVIPKHIQELIENGKRQAQRV